MSVIKGPIFIIGMPRSGTKLLRSLLNNHPLISILTNETEFLPYWDKNWDDWGGPASLSQFNNFIRFYDKAIKLPYFLYNKNQGKLITTEIWYKKCKNFSVSGVFEALAKHDANAENGIIWGDKSPGYIRNISLIKRLFPEAKIIHIVRDVRDYCLSIRAAWGKSMLRAAQRWVDDVSKARCEGSCLGQGYIELRFEDLLERPEQILKSICDFLGIDFIIDMLVIKRPSENIGNAKGELRIVSNNMNKWITVMDAKMVKKIERLSSYQLSSLKYPVSYYGQIKRIPSIQMQILKIIDGLNLIIRNKGNRTILDNFILTIRHAKTKLN